MIIHCCYSPSSFFPLFFQKDNGNRKEFHVQILPVNELTKRKLFKFKFNLYFLQRKRKLIELMYFNCSANHSTLILLFFFEQNGKNNWDWRDEKVNEDKKKSPVGLSSDRSGGCYISDLHCVVSFVARRWRRGRCRSCYPSSCLYSPSLFRSN